jgi:hypothetical protein
MAFKGIIVSAFVLTAEPLEAVLLPVFPMELRAWLRTALDAIAAAAVEAEDPEEAEAEAQGEDNVAGGIDADAAAGGVEDVMGENKLVPVVAVAPVVDVDDIVDVEDVPVAEFDAVDADDDVEDGVVPETPEEPGDIKELDEPEDEDVV